MSFPVESPSLYAVFVRKSGSVTAGGKRWRLDSVIGLGKRRSQHIDLCGQPRVCNMLIIMNLSFVIRGL